MMPIYLIFLLIALPRILIAVGGERPALILSFPQRADAFGDFGLGGILLVGFVELRAGEALG